jgi:glucose/arabinose dehydrogenase
MLNVVERGRSGSPGVGGVPLARRAAPSPGRAVAAAALLVLALVLPPGCGPGPHLIKPEERKSIDRAVVEYPAGYVLQPCIRNLTGATAIAFDEQGSIVIAEGGDGDLIRIYGFRINGDGSRFDIYPKFRRRLPGPLKALDQVPYKMYGPVGGMQIYNGKVYVSHRDADRLGRVTALSFDGTPTTVVAGLPARGDYGVTDIAINSNGRLFFGVGSATNSGVVGLDNFAWVRKYPQTHDLPAFDLKLLGLKFTERNPNAGLFGGGAENAVIGPYQPFGVNNLIRVPRARDGKPNSAIYSMPLEGGSASELTVECTGIRMPRGLAFNQYDRLYVTNNGMELRGTRPVKDDPDVMLRMIRGTDYQFPDLSADLLPISDRRFQPPLDLILPRGYPELSALVNRDESGLGRMDNDKRETLLQATFPSQSGAAKMVFVGPESAFAPFAGSAIVALSGDRAPFATSGRKLVGPVGYKLVRVDTDTRQVKDFVRNVAGTPAHQIDREFDDGVDALERPCDVKFGPDGALYILDMGRMQVQKDGREHFTPRTGQVFRLAPVTPETKEPVAKEKD